VEHSELEFRPAREEDLSVIVDAQRPDALRFYESLGFAATHHGMKLHFGPSKESS
jgi:hypothetical protein